MPQDPSPAPEQNRLLTALPKKEFKRVLPALEPVALGTKDVLHEPFQPIDYVYFPTSGLITKVATSEEGASIDVGMTGNEGMVGICCYLKSATAPFKAVVQIPGQAWRMSVSTFQAAVRGNAAWTDLLHPYTHAFLSMVSQLAACNLLHNVEQRFCRALLMAHDRMDADEFSLTQEALALMLGVRRQSISEAARRLAHRKLIQYRWGHVTILDRTRLEESACGCYQLIQKNFNL